MPLKAKPLFPNGPVKSDSSNQREHGKTKTQDGANKRRSESTHPQCTAKAFPGSTSDTTPNNVNINKNTDACQYQSLVTPKTVLNGLSSCLYGGGLIGSMRRQPSLLSGSSPSPQAMGLVLVSTTVSSHTDLLPKQLNFDLETSEVDWTDGVILTETDELGSYDDVMMEEVEEGQSDGNGCGPGVTANSSARWEGPGKIVSPFVSSSCLSLAPADSKKLTKQTSANRIPAVKNPPQATNGDACFKKPRPVSIGDDYRSLLRPFVHKTTTPSGSATHSSILKPLIPSCSAINYSLCKTTTPSSFATNHSRQKTTTPSSSATNSILLYTAAPSSFAINHSRQKTTTPCSSTTNSIFLHTAVPSSLASNHSLRNTATICSSTTYNSLHKNATSSSSVLPSPLYQSKTSCGRTAQRGPFKTTTPSSSFTIYRDVESQPSISTSTRTSIGGSFPVPPSVLSSRVNQSHLTSSRAACKVTSPLCGCGRRAKRLTVGNGGPNQGRAFFCCPVRRSGPGLTHKKGCEFFKWESSVLASVTPSVFKKTCRGATTTVRPSSVKTLR